MSRKSTKSIINGTKLTSIVPKKLRRKKKKIIVIKKKINRCDLLLKLLDDKESQWHDDEYELGKD